ncbi:hypothetical protein [Dysgonomonas macrotermitis]|uniref:Uncharacterized protein n=1 Tax=Dysgonomonas macrotermitis TaxID=1346286 RepID=A0A1M5F376_9BACT|nr:hypothetical protein [Dysgonomonas macrotermitis]SHF85621.1 hypothetical protein SAMN05444362_11129 [Dysgonomonas macrotermitis]
MKGRYLYSFMFGALLLGSFSWQADLKKAFSSMMTTDNIQLSEREASLDAGRDSAVFVTKGTCWWINKILVDGQPVEFKVADSQNDRFKLEGEWFTIERDGRQKLVVKADDNRFASPRNIKIVLEVGKSFDSIDIEQQGMDRRLAQLQE